MAKNNSNGIDMTSVAGVCKTMQPALNRMARYIILSDWEEKERTPGTSEFSDNTFISTATYG